LRQQLGLAVKRWQFHFRTVEFVEGIVTLNRSAGLQPALRDTFHVAVFSRGPVSFQRLSRPQVGAPFVASILVVMRNLLCKMNKT
jgi:hypothetical protein